MHSGLTFHGHISKVVSSGFFHLRSIASVKKYLRQDSLATLVHSFVGSRIDFCNSIFYGLPAYEIQRLQRLQNQASRLVTNNRKYDHITPILKNLHWLPVQQRIKFKIYLHAYKAVFCNGPEYLRLPQKIQTRSTRSSAAHSDLDPILE